MILVVILGVDALIDMVRTVPNSAIRPSSAVRRVRLSALATESRRRSKPPE